MNDHFDELAKGLAQSVTRRGALKQFGLGLAGIALATLGLANNAEATRGGGIHYNCQCKKPDFGCGKSRNPQECLSQCGVYCSQRHAQCPKPLHTACRSNSQAQARKPQLKRKTERKL